MSCKSYFYRGLHYGELLYGALLLSSLSIRELDVPRAKAETTVLQSGVKDRLRLHRPSFSVINMLLLPSLQSRHPVASHLIAPLFSITSERVERGFETASQSTYFIIDIKLLNASSFLLIAMPIT
jgi:hypothetical protein